MVDSKFADNILPYREYKFKSFKSYKENCVRIYFNFVWIKGQDAGKSSKYFRNLHCAVEQKILCKLFFARDKNKSWFNLYIELYHCIVKMPKYLKFAIKVSILTVFHLNSENPSFFWPKGWNRIYVNRKGLNTHMAKITFCALRIIGR